MVRDPSLGVKRFEEFQEQVGISRSILRERLPRPLATGVLVKVASSDHPPRYDCRLTDEGRDVWSLIAAMREWSDGHSAVAGPPVQLIHQALRQARRRPADLLDLRRVDQRTRRQRDGRTPRGEAAPWERTPGLR
jgi:DNA-binding HxlR family transcriptional regulator